MTTRTYEALVMLKAAGTDAEVARLGTQVEELVKKLGGRIEGSQGMGRRRLAYRIARQSEGYYYLIQFQMAPSQLDELKRLLRLNETIVRYLVLSRAPKPPAPPASAKTPAAAAVTA